MIRYKKDTDNIVTLTLDMSDRTVNVINQEIGAAFVPVVEHLKQEKAKRKLNGVILTSGKKTFLSGGDLEYLYQASKPEEIFKFSQKLNQFFRDLEHPGVPVVAAINGSALGTGFELALACHHRVVIDHPQTLIGHPEVNLGLIPAGGGVIRLMWLLGIEKAFNILSSGVTYNPQEALQVGLVDALAKDEKDMLDQAKNWLLQNKEGRRPWDRTNGKIPQGSARNPKTAILIQKLAAQLVSKTFQNYPAQQSILSVLHEGSKVDFDTACRIESRYFTELVISQTCKNMIQAFWFDANAIRDGEKRPKGFGKFRPKRVGIIGAGVMGSGIAYSCLMNGMTVVLKDVSKAVAEKGLNIVKGKLRELIQIGRITAEEKKQLIGKITTTESSHTFEDCDIVIEAVFENQRVKQKVTKEAEEYIDEYSLFASNTLSIPITKLAEASLRPANYVGLHFFHPAEKVPLVEIVRGAKTSDETIARAFDFVKAIRKTPIIVKDDWGFYAARVQNTYILEGISMLQEGYPPALIENLGLQSGMPKGALAFADDLGINMVLKYEEQAAAHYGPKYTQHPAVEVLQLMLNELIRSGRNKKAGFYEYDDQMNRRLWTELANHFPQKKRKHDHNALIERFLFAQVIEASWCMQEGVIQSIPEANLGSIYGWGFPAFKGGVFQYVVDYGQKAFIQKAKKLEKAHGQRFKIPTALKKIIQEPVTI